MTATGWQRSWVRILTTLLTAAVMVMIFAFSTEDAEHSDRTSGLISKRVLSIFHPDYEQLEESRQKILYDDVQHAVRKCAHFTEYTMLGLMLRLCLESWFGSRMKKLSPLALIGFGAGTAYACSDEMHQLAIEGRSGQWTDVLVDGSGVLAGVMLATLLIRGINRKDALRKTAEA